MAEVAADWVWGAVFVALLAGMALGMIVAFAILPGSKQAKKLREELEQLRSESETFKGNVNQHFEKTAELFQGLTVQYRAFYEHLATGAQDLCKPDPNAPRLDIPDMLALGAGRGEPDAEAPDSQPKPSSDAGTFPGEGDAGAEADTESKGEQRPSPEAVRDVPAPEESEARLKPGEPPTEAAAGESDSEPASDQRSDSGTQESKDRPGA